LIQRVEGLKKKLTSLPSVTQVPIVSTVPASSIAESAAAKVVVPAQRPSFSKPSFVRSTPVQSSSHEAQREAQQSTISDGELLSRWQEFILEIRRQKIALGSVMDSTMPLGVSGGVIRIGCANEFQASSIRRNKELLCDIVQKVFNSRARIEPEITLLTQKPAMAASGMPQLCSPEEEHPIIKAMIRELGVEPLR
jgi:hypothetical protein